MVSFNLGHPPCIGRRQNCAKGTIQRGGHDEWVGVLHTVDESEEGWSPSPQKNLMFFSVRHVSAPTKIYTPDGAPFTLVPPHPSGHATGYYVNSASGTWKLDM